MARKYIIGHANFSELVHTNSQLGFGDFFKPARFSAQRLTVYNNGEMHCRLPRIIDGNQNSTGETRSSVQRSKIFSALKKGKPCS